MKKDILIDLDSTVADILTPWIANYNAEHGDDLKLSEITSWDMHNHAKSGGVKIYDVIAKPGFFRDLLPYEGAVEAVRVLNERHNVHIVTAVEYAHGAAEKLDWVKKHLPFLTKRQIILAHSKHMLKADVLIDDAPHNAIAYREAHPDSLIFGLWFPYNQLCLAFTTLFYGCDTPAKAWSDIVDRLGT